MTTSTPPRKTPLPTLYGLSVAAILGLWAALVWLAPLLLGWTGTPAMICTGIAISLALIAYIGLFIELGQLTRNAGVPYLGWGLFFALLGFLFWFQTSALGWHLFHLFLIGLGGTLIFWAIPYFFWRAPEDFRPSIDGARQEAEVRVSDRPRNSEAGEMESLNIPGIRKE